MSDARAIRSKGGFAILRRLIARMVQASMTAPPEVPRCRAAGWPVATGSTENGRATCPQCNVTVQAIKGPAARFRIIADHPE
jgi:hypothetical protein